MKEAALKAIQDARAAVKASRDSLSAPELNTGNEDDAVKHARSALSQANSVLEAEEDFIGILLLNDAQTPNDGSPPPLAAPDGQVLTADGHVANEAALEAAEAKGG